MRWHYGRRIPGKKRRWINQWIGHPCPDLAYIFEVGTRAAHHV